MSIRNPLNVPDRLIRVDALAAADGAGFFASPASLLIQIRAEPDHCGDWRARVLAAGRPADVRGHPAHRSTQLEVVSQPRAVLIPGLVNAHAHLDLTHLGPQPHDPAAGFMPWIDMVRAGRHVDEESISDSVKLGIRLSLAAGTVAIGDIAGAPRGRPSLSPWRAMRELGARGVSYVEFFGIGRGADAKLDEVVSTISSADRRTGDPVIGIQPHAPNTVAKRSFQRIAAPSVHAGRPTATHLAETPEEREFVAHGRGPQRELLERLGIWDDTILADVGFGQHPVEYLAAAGGLPNLVAHVNDATDAAIATLSREGTAVVYCPHASEYFGASRHFGPHRYRDMLQAGIVVALGTDSIINLPPGSAQFPAVGQPLNSASGISILREMRLVRDRDGADPISVLRMATIHGARALGLDVSAFSFGDGFPLAGLLAIDVGSGQSEFGSGQEALRSLLASDAAPAVLFADNISGLAGILAAAKP